MNLELPRIIAHRGASDSAPENTLIAFKLAKQRGNTWVEFDVQLSADNVPVVLHDNTLERTTNGQGLVYEKPLSYLKTLDAGSWFDKKFQGETIPTLAETLDWLDHLGLSANIEIKDSPNIKQNRKTAQIVCEFLKTRSSFENEYLVSSFCFEALKVVRDILPKQPIGMLLESITVEQDWERQKASILKLFNSLQCYSLNLNQNGLSKELVHALLLCSPRILTYTVNDKARAETLFGWGITGVFSDALS